MFFPNRVFFPLSLVYSFITSVRNHLFDLRILKSCAFNRPTICIGNLKVGGTGKTPHVEYLVEFLSQQQRVAILSRGYGRETSGFLLANEANPTKVGDEPALYFQKFHDNVVVAVGEDRCAAIENLFSLKNPDVIVLDDAFQHRKLSAGLNILLTEYGQPFFNDYVMPAGWLRERRKGAKRADIVVVTKCPESISTNEKQAFVAKVRNYSGNKAVFFSGYAYGKIIPLQPEAPIMQQGKVIALSGIANPETFFREVEKSFEVAKNISYPDHHKFTENDLIEIKNTLKRVGAVGVITTEKDGIKLRKFNNTIDFPVYLLPIKVKFLEQESEFLQIISKFVKK